MNIDTGLIKQFESDEEAMAFMESNNRWAMLEGKLTAEQKVTKKVSKHDNKSPAGKQWTGIRKEVKMSRSAKKRFKREPTK